MDLVQVAVPENRLIEVYALLGTSPAPAVSGSVSAGNGTKPWTREALALLLGEASDTIRGEAKYLASRPGEEVMTDEIAAALNLPHGWNSVAGANGAWGRKLDNRGYAFPWSSRNATDGRSRMKMSEEIAALINEVI
jgi:hypothetical protein